MFAIWLTRFDLNRNWIELPTRPPFIWGRICKYLLARLASLIVMVVFGIFISIVVINYGGKLDEIYEAAIIEAVPKMAANYPNLTYEEREPILAQIKWEWEERLGLHSPFLLRCLRWTAQAMVFNGQDPAGTGYWRGQDLGTLKAVLTLFPKTLLLVGTANLLIFIVSLFLGLFLARREGGFLDKLAASLVPFSSIPNWGFAILLTAIFAWQLNILPAQGTYDMFPPKYPIGYIWVVLKHMILPILALFLGVFFQLLYSWRSLFLITCGEDYVELAKAKGLPEGMIRKRYLIKPTMPFVITSFALIFLTMWQGIIILEKFFNWQGIGEYFYFALITASSNSFGKVQMMTLIVVFIYLIAITMLILDVVYALVDPRIRVGGQEKTLRTVSRKKSEFKNASNGNRILLLQERKSERFGQLQNSLSKIIKETILSIRRSFNESISLAAQTFHRPSAIVGILIISLLILLMIGALIFLPKNAAINLWSPVSGEVFVNPRLAMPVWTNLFRKNPLPTTIILNSDDPVVRTDHLFAPNVVSLDRITFEFGYTNTNFPQDLAIQLTTKFNKLASLVTLRWITPDGRSLELGKITANKNKLFVASQQLPAKITNLYQLETRLNSLGREAFTPVDVLFSIADTRKIETAKGNYRLILDVQNFEPGASVKATMVLYGKVYGIAGTDGQRRDILVPLLWGIPIALIFGVLGATLTVVFSLLFASLGTWKGGWLDSLIQRISEINLVIPVIPFAIMFFYLYNESIWAVLAVFVFFNIFGSSLKTFRAALLQIKDASYIEAAQAYGASDWRIITHYLIPYLLPIVIPQWITLIPAYVFIEASMSFFGVFDPVLPTWGKLIYDAFTGGALGGHYYWILEPVGMIVLMGLAFALLGHAMDDVLNPKLKKS